MLEKFLLLSRFFFLIQDIKIQTKFRLSLTLSQGDDIEQAVNCLDKFMSF